MEKLILALALGGLSGGVLGIMIMFSSLTAVITGFGDVSSGYAPKFFFGGVLLSIWCAMITAIFAALWIIRSK